MVPPVACMFDVLKFVLCVVVLFRVLAVNNVVDTLARLLMYPPVITTLLLLKFVACATVEVTVPVKLPVIVVATTLPVKVPVTLPVSVPDKVVATTLPCTVPCNCLLVMSTMTKSPVLVMTLALTVGFNTLLLNVIPGLTKLKPGIAGVGKNLESAFIVA